MGLSRIGAAVLLQLLSLLGTVLHAHAEARAFDEYQVKAAFLFNLAKFVEWPPGTFTHAKDPIAICIAGQYPFGSALDDMLQGKTAGDRGFTLRRLPDAQQAAECQILFIGATEWKRTRSLPEALKGSAVLTVGETSDFAELGGIIGLRLEGTRIHIQISIDAADRARLHISSKLLGLAEIVKKKP